MKQVAVGLLGCILISEPLTGKDYPVWTNESIPMVDAVVARLVSRAPAPHPGGGIEEPARTQLRSLLQDGIYATPEVREAFRELRELKPRFLFALNSHMSDKRFCFGHFYAYTNKPDVIWFNLSVADVIQKARSNNLEGIAGYSERLGGGGREFRPPSFDEYEKSLKPSFHMVVMDWSRKQLDLAYLDYCIAKEKENGFVSEDQKEKILDVYEEEKKKITSK